MLTWLRLVLMQHHHIAVVLQLDPRELPGRLQHRLRIGAAWHRQHQIEGFAPRTDLPDQRATVAPLLGQVVQSLPALAHNTPVVLKRQPPGLADVPEVGGDGSHAPPSPSDLDHHLWSTPHHRCLDAAANPGSLRAYR